MPPFQKHQRLFHDAKTERGTFPARTLLEDIARAAAVLHEIGGRVYLPRLAEDVRGKIDLIYQVPTLERGLCLQVKSDAAADETTHVVFDEATAAADPEGYLDRFLEGVRILGRCSKGIVWTQVLLIVGQRPFLDRPVVHGRPPIFRGVHAMLAGFLGCVIETPVAKPETPPYVTQEPAP